MFTKSMANELGPKCIRVNSIRYSISPFTMLIHLEQHYSSVGPTKTKFMEAMGMSEKKANEFYDRMSSELPVGRVGQGLDIAMAVMFLATDANSFITGSDFVVDGGAVAKSVIQ